VYELAQGVENHPNSAHLRGVGKMDGTLLIFVLLLSELNSVLVDTEGVLEESIPHFFDDQITAFFLSFSELAEITPLPQCSTNVPVLPDLHRPSHPFPGPVVFYLLRSRDICVQTSDFHVLHLGLGRELVDLSLL